MPKGKVKAEDKEPSTMTYAVTEAAKPFIEVLRRRQPGQHFTDEEDDALVKVLLMVDGNIGRASRLTGLAISTVWQVKDRQMVAFTEQREVWKRQHARRTQDVADMTLEKLADGIHDSVISPRDAAITWGILVQRGMDLAGEGATVTHKVIHSVDQAALGVAMERLQAIRGVSEDDVGEAEFRVVE